MSEHRLGINPGFLTTHALGLCGLNEVNTQSITEELNNLPCVDAVFLNQKMQIIKIAYDASHHNIDEILAIIESGGAMLKDSWWSRTKMSWQRQTDENIRDNAKHVAHCCNKMPRHW